MSIAKRVIEAIGDSCTFSLYAGYCLRAGQQVSFPQGSQEIEKRNEKGQVSTARYKYADGSIVVYKRLPDNRYELTEGK